MRGSTSSVVHAACMTSATPGTCALLMFFAARKNKLSCAMAKQARAPASTMPLMQPKVEIMMAMAMICAPAPGIHRAHHGAGHAIERRRLHLVERQHHQISDVRQQVQTDHDRRPEGQRQRHVAARRAHFARREGDVVPGVGGKERSGLRHAQRHQQAERRLRRQARGDGREAARRPCIPEVPRHRLRDSIPEKCRVRSSPAAIRSSPP